MLSGELCRCVYLDWKPSWEKSWFGGFVFVLLDWKPSWQKTDLGDLFLFSNFQGLNCCEHSIADKFLSQKDLDATSNLGLLLSPVPFAANVSVIDRLWLEVLSPDCVIRVMELFIVFTISSLNYFVLCVIQCHERSLVTLREYAFQLHIVRIMAKTSNQN